jgi:hypothetical protein
MVKILKNYITYINILYRHTQYVTYMTLPEFQKEKNKRSPHHYKKKNKRSSHHYIVFDTFPCVELWALLSSSDPLCFGRSKPSSPRFQPPTGLPNELGGRSGTG